MGVFFRSLSKRFLPGDSVAQRGILWNMGSFIIIGISGILMNVLIGFFYNPSVLGVFNLSMSFYIVIGQVGSMGLQNAAIYYTPRQNNKNELGSLFSSFLCISFVVSLACALCFWLITDPLGKYIFHSEDLSDALRAVAPALIFFSLNKVLLGFINSLRCMRAFAILQGSRYLLIILFILFSSLLRAPGGILIHALLVAEVILFVIAIIFLLRQFTPRMPKYAKIRQGLAFGVKSMVGGVIGELNTKVDILVLGIFCSDSIVGIYSFASMLAEGFFSLIGVLRNNLNPLFAQILHQKNYALLQNLKRQIKRRTLPLCVIGAICILLGFWILCMIMPSKAYSEAILPLAIILFCMTLASTNIVKGNILTQSGRPELDTIITLLSVCINAGLNFTMIPFLGMVGAAIATGVSYLFFMVSIHFFVKKYIG